MNATGVCETGPQTRMQQRFVNLAHRPGCDRGSWIWPTDQNATEVRESGPQTRMWQRFVNLAHRPECNRGSWVHPTWPQRLQNANILFARSVIISPLSALNSVQVVGSGSVFYDTGRINSKSAPRSICQVSLVFSFQIPGFVFNFNWTTPASTHVCSYRSGLRTKWEKNTTHYAVTYLFWAMKRRVWLVLSH